MIVIWQERTQCSIRGFGQTSPRVHRVKCPHREVLHARHEVHLEGMNLALFGKVHVYHGDSGDPWSAFLA